MPGANLNILFEKIRNYDFLLMSKTLVLIAACLMLLCYDVTMIELFSALHAASVPIISLSTLYTLTGLTVYYIAIDNILALC